MLGLFVSVESGEDVDGGKDGSGQHFLFVCLLILFFQEGGGVISCSCVFRPCMAAIRVFLKPHRSAASAVYSLLQHCLRWFTTREEANTRGRGGRREKSNPSNTNYQKEKI